MNTNDTIYWRPIAGAPKEYPILGCNKMDPFNCRRLKWMKSHQAWVTDTGLKYKPTHYIPHPEMPQ